MEMIKIKSIIFGICTSIFALISIIFCNPSSIVSPNLNEEYANYDDNTNLISNESDTYTLSGLSFAERKFNPDNKILFSGRKFVMYGLQTLMKVDAKENQKVKFKFNGESEKGHYKIIFIDPDDNVQTLFEDDKVINDEIEFKKGINQIKIVGKPAQIKSINVKIKNIDLSKVDILDLDEEIKEKDEKKKQKELEKANNDAQEKYQKAVEKAQEDYQKALDKAQSDLEKSTQ